MTNKQVGQKRGFKFKIRTFKIDILDQSNQAQ